MNIVRTSLLNNTGVANSAVPKVQFSQKSPFEDNAKEQPPKDNEKPLNKKQLAKSGLILGGSLTAIGLITGSVTVPLLTVATLTVLDATLVVVTGKEGFTKDIARGVKRKIKKEE